MSENAEPTEPQGELAIKTLAMPSDTNPNGDIFGGWIVGQMDLAGTIVATKSTRGRNVTVAIDSMSFRKPVYVGDVVSVYADVARVGHTSLTLNIQAWVIRKDEIHPLLVTEGKFTYVAVDKDGRPRPINN